MTPSPQPTTTVAREHARGRTGSPLTDEMLGRFSKRASRYDQDNSFFAEDFDELRRAGYLRLAVPVELGGLGLTDLAEGRRC